MLYCCMHSAVLTRLWKLRPNPKLAHLRGTAFPPEPRGDPCTFYQAMSREEEERAACVAVELRRTGYESESDTILKYLAAFGSGDGLRAVYKDILKDGVFHPAFIWRFADDALVPELARHLGRDAISTHRLLAALAWFSGQASVALFQSLRHSTPRWASLLHRPPLDYTLAAGWMLRQDGTVRRLYRERCVPLLPTEGRGIPVWQELAEPCGFCGRPLWSLLAAVPTPDAVDAATCVACNDYGTVYSTSGGLRRWVDDSPRHTRLPGPDLEYPLPSASVTIGPPRSPFMASDGELPITLSQVGGLPSWVQEPEYPACFRCGERMDFAVQVDSFELEENAEGIYYVFHCTPCALAAMVRQQT